MTQMEDLVAKVLGTIAPIYAKQGIDALMGQVRKAIVSLQQSRGMETGAISELAETIKEHPPSAVDLQSNVDTLSRWFEIARDDFAGTPVEQLTTEVMIRHVYLEQQFTLWLEDLGYELAGGEKMIGVEGWEFAPDVFGTLDTIHGRFQLAINFICSDPPNTPRVSFLLESAEAFARRREPEFSEKDIYMLVTPFRFGQSASAAIAKEDKDHSYYVVKVEGSHVSRLVGSDDMASRLEIFQGIVKEAYGAGGVKTWA